MKEEIHKKIQDIGFTLFDTVSVEHPSKIFLSTTPFGGNINTAIYLYYKTNYDFVILYPIMNADKFRVEYYGEVDKIKEQIEKLEGEI